MTSQLHAEDALQRLMEGNERYMTAHAVHPHESARYRQGLVSGQHPFAVILGCADSRVPPELLFDQGFGDLFVIRVAGNLVDDLTLASIEYAVCMLDVSLVMVLGHSQCGAVSTAVNHTALDALPGHLPSLVADIQPAVEATRAVPGDPLDNAIRFNTRRSARILVESDCLSQYDRLKIVAAHYDLETGKVELLD